MMGREDGRGTFSPQPGAPTGCWVAYYFDRSGIYPFPDELSCLRYAAGHGMEAKFVRWGDEVLTESSSGQPPA